MTEVIANTTIPPDLARLAELHARGELVEMCLEFQNLIEQGAPWPEVPYADLQDWPHDPVARIPALMNVMAWGVKPGEKFNSST